MANEEPITNPPNPPKQATAGQGFKLAAIIVCGFSLLAFITHVFVAVFGPETDAVELLIENCVKIYQTGFGAFLGLIAGKSL